MPNFFSAFNAEVFRPIVTLLIPGAIGISTWFIGLVWHFESVRSLIHESHSDTVLILLLAMIFAGLVFEDFGSRIEKWLDRCSDRKCDGRHSDEWEQYLRTCFKADPIGRGYIRTLVLRLKFELGIACAMLCAGSGLIWLSIMGLSACAVLANEFICLTFFTWGLYEAISTHRALAKNRANLLREIRVVEGKPAQTEIC